MSPVRASALAAVIATVLAGCAVAPPETYLAVQEGPPPLAQAGVGYEFVLALSDEGCWGTSEGTVVFPMGTAVQGDGSGIIFDDGTEAELGALLVGGGNLVDYYTAALPEQCPAENVFVFYLGG